MKRKNLLKVLFVLGIIFLLSGVVMASNYVTINMALAPVTDNTVLFVGIEKGIFEKHGIDVKSKFFASGIEMVKAVQSGYMDYATIGPPPFLSALEKDIDVVVVAMLQGAADNPNGGVDNDMAIVAGPNTGIENPKDLEGKNIGAFVGTIGHQYLYEVLKKNGISLDSVNVKNIKDTELITALQTGAIDAFAYWEPHPSLTLKRVKGSKLVVQGGNYMARLGMVFTSGKYLRNNAADVQKFVNAYSEASFWVRNNREEAAEVAARWITGIDKETALNSLSILCLDNRISQGTIKGTEGAIDFLKFVGKVGGSIDISKAFDGSFIKNSMEDYPEFFSDLPEIKK